MDLIKQFRIEDSFIGKYERLVKDVVVPYQEKAIHDALDIGEKSHAVKNFELAAQKLETGECTQEFYGMVFQDSDVAKWLEAAAYTLEQYPDKELEQRCDCVIDLIGRAQWEDGYLNTYFTVKTPEKRWSNLEEAHELYCAGHMMEAGVAYFEATGKCKLLDIVSRMGDHIYNRFIVEGVEGYPGHPEIELALMRLYHCTGNVKYKQLAEHFINVRGVDKDYYLKEREKNDWAVWGPRLSTSFEYNQAHLPVREQSKAVGHAVRAVYLYSAMADVVLETQDEDLLNACKTLWNNITEQRMYVTGAIGSAYEGEAFTKDYHLPNDTAYAETCASIGLMFFARRMLELETNSNYSDTMERAFYNSVLPGMELDGTKFFYVNPLEVIPGISGEASTHHHARPVRPHWFACACCPPNVARLLPSIARYAWGQKDHTVFSHLFIGGELDLSDAIGGKIIVESRLPYEGQVEYRFETPHETMPMSLAIRVPYWSGETNISLNEEQVDYEMIDGYAYIKEQFKNGDMILVTFEMSMKKIYSNSKIGANSGKVAFQRGPLIYCAEGVDNEEDILSLAVKAKGNIRAEVSNDLGGIVNLYVEGERRYTQGNLYSFDAPDTKPVDIKLIPYYTWGNRGLNEMRIWLPQ